MISIVHETSKCKCGNCTGGLNPHVTVDKDTGAVTYHSLPNCDEWTHHVSYPYKEPDVQIVDKPSARRPLTSKQQVQKCKKRKAQKLSRRRNR